MPKKTVNKQFRWTSKDEHVLEMFATKPAPQRDSVDKLQRALEIMRGNAGGKDALPTANG